METSRPTSRHNSVLTAAPSSAISGLSGVPIPVPTRRARPNNFEEDDSVTTKSSFSPLRREEPQKDRDSLSESPLSPTDESSSSNGSSVASTPASSVDSTPAGSANSSPASSPPAKIKSLKESLEEERKRKKTLAERKARDEAAQAARAILPPLVPRHGITISTPQQRILDRLDLISEPFDQEKLVRFCDEIKQDLAQLKTTTGATKSVDLKGNFSKLVTPAIKTKITKLTGLAANFRRGSEQREIWHWITDPFLKSQMNYEKQNLIRTVLRPESAKTKAKTDPTIVKEKAKETLDLLKSYIFNFAFLDSSLQPHLSDRWFAARHGLTGTDAEKAFKNRLEKLREERNLEIKASCAQARQKLDHEYSRVKAELNKSEIGFNDSDSEEIKATLQLLKDELSVSARKQSIDLIVRSTKNAADLDLKILEKTQANVDIGAERQKLLAAPAKKRNKMIISFKTTLLGLAHTRIEEAKLAAENKAKKDEEDIERLYNLPEQVFIFMGYLTQFLEYSESLEINDYFLSSLLRDLNKICDVLKVVATTNERNFNSLMQIPSDLTPFRGAYVFVRQEPIENSKLHYVTATGKTIYVPIQDKKKFAQDCAETIAESKAPLSTAALYKLVTANVKHDPRLADAHSLREINLLNHSFAHRQSFNQEKSHPNPKKKLGALIKMINASNFPEELQPDCRRLINTLLLINNTLNTPMCSAITQRREVAGAIERVSRAFSAITHSLSHLTGPQVNAMFRDIDAHLAEMFTCNLYLMPTKVPPAKTNECRVSDSHHLYLYTDTAGKLFYRIKINNDFVIVNLEDRENTLDNALKSEIALNNEFADLSQREIMPCQQKNICAAVLAITAKKGHTNPNLDFGPRPSTAPRKRKTNSHKQGVSAKLRITDHKHTGDVARPSTDLVQQLAPTGLAEHVESDHFKNSVEKHIASVKRSQDKLLALVNKITPGTKTAFVNPTRHEAFASRMRALSKDPNQAALERELKNDENTFQSLIAYKNLLRGVWELGLILERLKNPAIAAEFNGDHLRILETLEKEIPSEEEIPSNTTETFESLPERIAVILAELPAYSASSPQKHSPTSLAKTIPKFYQEDEMEFLSLSALPENMDTLPISTHQAYVRVRSATCDKLYFVNTYKKQCVDVPLSTHELNQFDAIMLSEVKHQAQNISQAKTILPEQLRKMAPITHCQHGYQLSEDDLKAMVREQFNRRPQHTLVADPDAIINRTVNAIFISRNITRLSVFITEALDREILAIEAKMAATKSKAQEQSKIASALSQTAYKSERKSQTEGSTQNSNVTTANVTFSAAHAKLAALKVTQAKLDDLQRKESSTASFTISEVDVLDRRLNELAKEHKILCEEMDDCSNAIVRESLDGLLDQVAAKEKSEELAIVKEQDDKHAKAEMKARQVAANRRPSAPAKATSLTSFAPAKSLEEARNFLKTAQENIVKAREIANIKEAQAIRARLTAEEKEAKHQLILSKIQKNQTTASAQEDKIKQDQRKLGTLQIGLLSLRSTIARVNDANLKMASELKTTLEKESEEVTACKKAAEERRDLAQQKCSAARKLLADSATLTTSTATLATLAADWKTHAQKAVDSYSTLESAAKKLNASAAQLKLVAEKNVTTEKESDDLDATLVNEEKSTLGIEAKRLEAEVSADNNAVVANKQQAVVSTHSKQMQANENAFATATQALLPQEPVAQNSSQQPASKEESVVHSREILAKHNPAPFERVCTAITARKKLVKQAEEKAHELDAIRQSLQSQRTDLENTNIRLRKLKYAEEATRSVAEDAKMNADSARAVAELAKNNLDRAIAESQFYADQEAAEIAGQATRAKNKRTMKIAIGAAIPTVAGGLTAGLTTGGIAFAAVGLAAVGYGIATSPSTSWWKSALTVLGGLALVGVGIALSITGIGAIAGVPLIVAGGSLVAGVATGKTVNALSSSCRNESPAEPPSAPPSADPILSANQSRFNPADVRMKGCHAAIMKTLEKSAQQAGTTLPAGLSDALEGLVPAFATLLLDSVIREVEITINQNKLTFTNLIPPNKQDAGRSDWVVTLNNDSTLFEKTSKSGTTTSFLPDQVEHALFNESLLAAERNSSSRMAAGS